MTYEIYRGARIPLEETNPVTCPDCLEETDRYCPECDYCEDCAAPICGNCDTCFDCCQCVPSEDDSEGLSIHEEE